MPYPSSRLAKGASALLLAASCATPPPTGAALDLAHPGAIEPSAEDGGWRAGDSVLLRVDLEGPGEARTWYVKLSVPPGAPLVPSGRKLTMTAGNQERATPSADVRVVAEVYGAEGQLLDRSSSQVGELLLRTGYVPYCEHLLALPPGPRDPDAPAPELNDELFGAIIGMLSFPMLLTAVQENDSLADLFWEVIEAPSFLSVLFSGGTIDLGIEAPEDGVRRLENAASGAAYEVDIELTLQDELALLLTVEVTDSSPPLQLVAGVVAFVGTHPDEPERVLRGRVLSAQRGDPPGWSAEYSAGGVTTVRMLDELP